MVLNIIMAECRSLHTMTHNTVIYDIKRYTQKSKDWNSAFWCFTFCIVISTICISFLLNLFLLSPLPHTVAITH